MLQGHEHPGANILPAVLECLIISPRVIQEGQGEGHLQLDGIRCVLGRALGSEHIGSLFGVKLNSHKRILSMFHRGYELVPLAALARGRDPKG